MSPSRSPKRKSSRRRPSRRSNQNGRLLAAGLFVAGFLVAVLALLQQLRPVPSPQLPYEEPRAERPSEDSRARVRVELESLLLRSGYAWSGVEVRERQGVVHYLVRGTQPPEEFWIRLDRRLQAIDPALVLEPGGAEETRILEGGRPRLVLRFRPSDQAPATAADRPRVAIVIDDLGRSLDTVAALLDLQMPLSYAVLPGEKLATQAAELIHSRGGEILIHIPMEPQSYPATNPGRDALLVGMPESEIRRRFQGYRQRVPHAVGGNNHMGSRFTEYGEGMRVLQEEMLKAGMFFLDSRTTGGSVTSRTAREVGLPHLSRDIFLDNVAEVDYVAEQLRRLLDTARRQGWAIGIGHPHAATVAALRREAPQLLGSDVELVEVSRLLGEGN